MVEFFKISSLDIVSSNYPLNHDCLIKIVYSLPLVTHNVEEFFSCRSHDSGLIVGILSQIFCIRKIFVVSSDEVTDEWLKLI